MVNNLSAENSILLHFITEIRDEVIQKDSLRFRRNLERIGEIFAYEISKGLNYIDKETTTPLGIANSFELDQQPVLATILRAGLPLHQGLHNYFDKAENAFVSAYRKTHKDGSFEVHVEYMASADISGKDLIICDPMLATGKSMELSYKALKLKGIPRSIHVVAVISSREALDYIKQIFPVNTTFWIGAIDEELTAQAYIVPGLGDAGDLAYGTKE
jgi:uracil phosphoribosyltransferase